MDALELAYTPHPAMRPRVSLMAPAAPSRRENETRGLAVAAVASLALIGAAAVLGAPRGEASAPSVGSPGRVFESRAESVAQSPALAMPAPRVAVAAAPAPVELRAQSPAPFLGDLGPEPEAPAAVTMSASPREQHVLTSFDGTRTMSDGPVIVHAAPSRAAAPARRAFSRAPVVWNRPLNWISTH